MEQTAIIEINVQGAEGLANAKAAMVDLRKEQTELTKAYKAGTVTKEDYIQKEAALIKAMEDNRKEQQELQKQLKASNKEQASLVQADAKRTGSLVEMRKELSALKKSYAELSKADRDSAKGLEMRDAVKKLNDEVSTIEQGTGVFSRNVGNYAKSITAALGPLIPGFGALTAQVTGAATAVTGLGTATAPAMAGVTKLNLALVATPIGAIAIALAGLIVYLTKFDGALDGIEQVLGGVSAAIQPLLKWLGALGKNVVDLLAPAGEVISKMAAALRHLANGDLQKAGQAFNEASAAVQQFGRQAHAVIPTTNGLADSMGRAYDAGVELAKMTQALDDAEADFAYNQTKYAKAIEQAEARAGDKTLAKTERLKELDRARMLSLEIGREEQKLQEDRARKIAKEVLVAQGLGERIKANTKLTTENVDALKAEVIALSDAGKLIGKREEVIAQLTEALTQQQEAEQKVLDVTLAYNEKSSKIRNQLAAEQQAQHDAKMRQLADAMAQVKRLADLEAQVATDDVERMRAQQKSLAVQLEMDQKAAKSKEERLLLATKYEQDVANLEAEYQAKRAQAEADAQKQRDEFAASVEGQELERINENNRARLAAILEAEANLGLAKDTAAQLRLESEATRLQELLEYQRQFGRETVDTQNAINAAKIRSDQDAAAKAKTIQAAQLETAKNVVNAMSSIMQIAATASGVGADFQKAMALTQIGIDTGVAIANIVAMSSASLDPVTFALKLSGGIATVLTNIASAYSMINSAATPQAPTFPKMARGGYIDGPGHSAGGVMRELEGGEMVMARGAVAQFGPMLNQMNMAGGGVGSIPISTAIQAAQNDMQQAQMTRAMESANMFLNVRDFARTTRNNTQPRNLARLT